MEKVEVGHKWPVPEDINILDINDIGGYSIILAADDTTKTYRILIQGLHTFDLSDHCVDAVCILPVHLQAYENSKVYDAEREAQRVHNIFNLDRYKVYYQVSYGDWCWIFNTIDEAIMFSSIVAQYKATGLKDNLDIEREQNGTN